MMAATVAAAKLTEAHRVAQARLGASTVGDLHQIWPLLDPEDLDATFARWATAANRLIQARRAESASMAANYLRAFKTLELGPTAPVVLVTAGPAPAEQVATSLLVTGPVSVKRSVSVGVGTVAAMDNAEARSAAAGMRHVLNGGRDTIHDSVIADRQALGWARTTSGRPCGFCAMLASRGPVYLSEASASRQADGRRYHDHCHCGVEPVYRADAEWPAGGSHWRDLWEHAKDEDGDTTAVFRRLVEAA